MFTHPDGFRCLYATRRALFGGSSGFDLDDVRAVQVAFVFEEGDELSPRRILLVPSIMRLFEHPLHIQVFHEHGIVLFDEPHRDFVLVVQHLPSNPTLDLGDLQTLLLIVVRAFLFARQLPLLAAKTLVVVFEVKPIHGFAIAGVDVVQDTEVNPNAVTRVERVQRRFLRKVSVVGFQPKGDEPLASRLLLERHLFDSGVVWNRTVVTDFDPANLAEANVSKPVVAPLFIEVETTLVVRHAPILGGCLPLETTNVVPFLFRLAEIREVPVEACNGGLCGF